MSGRVKVLAEMELVIGVCDPNHLLQVPGLEPALKHEGVGPEVGADRLHGRLGAPRHGPAEVVDLGAGLVMEHNHAVILAQGPGLGLLA